MSTTRVLSVHAAYGCRETGACCTSGWPIPIEADRLADVERAIADGRVTVVRSAAPGVPPRGSVVREARQELERRGSGHSGWSPGSSAPGDTPPILTTVDGACIFYRDAASARCALHHSLGHVALPLACRQFPRVCVNDPRGVSITLSHYCPTAAAMLDAAGAIAIVSGAPGFPADGEYVGLDVRDALPPALRPDMLMDWESWWLWEAEAVALIGAETSPVQALTRLSLAVEHVRDWSPGGEALTSRVSSAFTMARTSPRAAWTPPAFDDVAAGLVAATPADVQPLAEQALARRGATTPGRARVVFLAAHAFANWTAHLGEDLRTWFRSIEAAHVLITGGLSVRDADLLLRHLVDPRAMASGVRMPGQT